CVSPTGCNANGLPSFNGQRNCCPQNCTCSSPSGCPSGQYSACFQLIHGSHPHIHGQPSYFRSSAGEAVYWWGEKDYPRFMKWDSQTGLGVPVPGSSRLVDPDLNRVSADDSDLAPQNPQTQGGFGFLMGGMPGGLMSVSANGLSNAVLWANVPR